MTKQRRSKLFYLTCKNCNSRKCMLNVGDWYAPASDRGGKIAEIECLKCGAKEDILTGQTKLK